MKILMGSTVLVLLMACVNLANGLLATDPVAYARAGALVLLVGLASSWIPARGVMRVDPVEVLNES